MEALQKDLDEKAAALKEKQRQAEAERAARVGGALSCKRFHRTVRLLPTVLHVLYTIAECVVSMPLHVTPCSDNKLPCPTWCVVLFASLGLQQQHQALALYLVVPMLAGYSGSSCGRRDQAHIQ